MSGFWIFTETSVLPNIPNVLWFAWLYLSFGQLPFLNCANKFFNQVILPSIRQIQPCGQPMLRAQSKKFLIGKLCLIFTFLNFLNISCVRV
jgi:hypothetical protein